MRLRRVDGQKHQGQLTLERNEGWEIYLFCNAHLFKVWSRHRKTPASPQNLGGRFCPKRCDLLVSFILHAERAARAPLYSLRSLSRQVLLEAPKSFRIRKTKAIKTSTRSKIMKKIISKRKYENVSRTYLARDFPCIEEDRSRAQSLEKLNTEGKRCWSKKIKSWETRMQERWRKRILFRGQHNDFSEDAYPGWCNREEHKMSIENLKWRKMR